MDASVIDLAGLGTATRRLTRRLLTIGENRLVLLTVEAEGARERLLRARRLALAVAVFGLLTGLTLTALIVFSMWAYSPLGALAITTCLYGFIAVLLWRTLSRRLRNWQAFSASLDQLRKDRVWLEEVLA